jgi:hypothetical protein
MLRDLANGRGLCGMYAPTRGVVSLNFLSALILLLSGCSEAQVSADASGSGSALLSWSAPTTDSDGAPVTGLAGYHIYVGTDPNSLSLRGGVGDAATTTFTVSNLATGTYYFAVTAYNASGQESAFSNIGSKTF